MISITELHGAGAWRYLMESVTDGQGDLRKADAITRYYTEAGTPPGRCSVLVRAHADVGKVELLCG